MKPGSDGIYVAAPIWRDFIDKTLSQYPASSFIPYEKVRSNNLMVTGNIGEEETVYYDKKSGKIISAEKARDKKKKDVKKKKGMAMHDILFYINRNDPLGDTRPDLSDPMTIRWENSLEKYLSDDFDDSQKD